MSSRSGELQLLSLCAATAEAKDFFFFNQRNKKSIQAGTLGLSQADRPNGKIYNYKDICLKKKKKLNMFRTLKVGQKNTDYKIGQVDFIRMKHLGS